MNAELITTMTDSIMSLVAEWSMPLTFEEHTMLMERLAQEILSNLNTWKERHLFGQSCEWEPISRSIRPGMPRKSI